jgi:hypothetical protein
VAFPSVRNVILRGSTETGFMLINAVTAHRIAGPVPLQRAIEVARQHGAAVIWQENLDDRGRSLGSPFRLELV